MSDLRWPRDMERRVAQSRGLERRINAALSFFERLRRPLGCRPSDRSLRKYFSLQGLRRLGSLKVSHSVPCATVRYMLRAGNSGHKFPTPKNRTVRPYVSKILMGVSLLVGARGFEPPTSRSQTERTTRLCYAPKILALDVVREAGHSRRPPD
jgi:hypothetical protein